jgi:hypothetical protein
MAFLLLCGRVLRVCLLDSFLVESSVDKDYGWFMT